MVTVLSVVTKQGVIRQLPQDCSAASKGKQGSMLPPVPPPLLCKGFLAHTSVSPPSLTLGIMVTLLPEELSPPAGCKAASDGVFQPGRTAVLGHFLPESVCAGSGCL